MATKEKRVVLQAYYNLDGDYLPFDANPLHGKTYDNVSVQVERQKTDIAGITVESDLLLIEGEEPIECELVKQRRSADGTLTLGICQDWG